MWTLWFVVASILVLCANLNPFFLGRGRAIRNIRRPEDEDQR